MSGRDEEAPYVAAGEEESVARTALSDRPLRWAERCCPFLVRWLGAIGCEEALVVRDVTHLSLYLSCVLSLFCTVIWGADVCNGDCLLPRPWVDATVDRYRCVYEVLGVIVFFGTLFDSVQMLGNYDNDHRVLLRRKCRLMEEVRQETVEAMRRAEANTDQLTGMLLKGYEKKVREHVDEYFKNVWPVLFHGLDARPGPERELLQELNELVGRNLDEAGQLAVAYHRRMAALSEHLPGIRVAAPAERRPGFWRLLLRPPLEDDSEPGAASPAGRSSEIDAEVKRDPGKFVFAPVKEMVRFVSDALRGDYIQEVQRCPTESQYRTAERLCGCGRRTSADEAVRRHACACCLPRMLAYFLHCLSCCSCCRGRRKGCFSKAFGDYPKYLKIGCLWIKIISRLHERLVQGLVLTAVFCIVYGWSEFRIISSITISGLPEAQVMDCVWDLARRGVIMFALLCHIPALILCLVRIRDLEAVIRITEDIWRVRDIRRVVKELEKSVEVDKERQGLLQAVEDRVLARARLLHHFRLHVLRTAVRERREVLRAATEELVQCLRSINVDLRSAADWVELPVGEQRRLAQKVREHATEVGRSFVEAVGEAASDAGTPVADQLDDRRPSPRPPHDASDSSAASGGHPQERVRASGSVAAAAGHLVGRMLGGRSQREPALLEAEMPPAAK